MTDTNPFLNEWVTPYNIPPFYQIKEEHYWPAFEQGVKIQLSEIDSIINNSEEPSFANTVEALEFSGDLLYKVLGVFFNLISSHTNETLHTLQKKISPAWSRHQTSIYTNTALFSRVKAVSDSEEARVLKGEQHQLLKETLNQFLRYGVALDREGKNEIQSINEELAELFASFSQNDLKDKNAFELLIEEEKDLEGLPESVKDAAWGEADRRGKKNSWLFNISRSSITPFLQYAKNRELREKIYTAYIQCGSNENESNNEAIASRIASLRVNKAQLLGFDTFAEYTLDDRMAKTPKNVNELLDKIWAGASKKVREEAKDLQNLIQLEGNNFKLAPWDWWYYTEKLRASRYDFDENEIKPYFRLEAVRDAAFNVATRLYGLQFIPLSDFPKYHPDLQAYEVREADGGLTGIFLADYFLRPSKKSGAWMNAFRLQQNTPENVRPIIVNCCNFTKSNPCLLGLDEVRTLFHEFGHALHGLLSNTMYRSLSGTRVKRDFVELPSQIMENWALEPDVLRTFAKHYQTGEIIPESLIEKIGNASTFNQGFATTEYLAACYLDMHWHSLNSDNPQDPHDIEDNLMRDIGMISSVSPRYHSTYFQHIFSGDGYSAGYYAYIWAEVLDADGFEVFKENGLFDQKTALSFRKNILEKGGSEDPMVLYRRFRGRDPEVSTLIDRRGLN